MIRVDQTAGVDYCRRTDYKESALALLVFERKMRTVCLDDYTLQILCRAKKLMCLKMGVYGNRSIYEICLQYGTFICELPNGTAGLMSCKPANWIIRLPYRLIIQLAGL